MKFVRTDLIERVRNEIKRRETEAKAETGKAAEAYSRRRLAYVRDVNPLWTGLADRIRSRVRNGQPLTLADIPDQLIDRSWGRSSNRQVATVTLWDDTEPVPETARTEELHTLLALLESTDVETVTLATLDRLGFKMTQLFRQS